MVNEHIFGHITRLDTIVSVETSSKGNVVLFLREVHDKYDISRTDIMSADILFDLSLQVKLKLITISYFIGFRHKTLFLHPWCSQPEEKVLFAKRWRKGFNLHRSLRLQGTLLLNNAAVSSDAQTTFNTKNRRVQEIIWYVLFVETLECKHVPSSSIKIETGSPAALECTNTYLVDIQNKSAIPSLVDLYPCWDIFFQGFLNMVCSNLLIANHQQRELSASLSRCVSPFIKSWNVQPFSYFIIFWLTLWNSDIAILR